MRRPRRSAEQIRADALRQWRINKQQYHAGNYRCAKCGDIKFCTGKSRERVKCAVCFGIEERPTDPDKKAA